MDTHRSARRLAGGLLAVSIMVAGGTTATASTDSSAPRQWVGSWSAPVAPPAGGRAARGFSDLTLRQVAHLSVGGDEVRIRVSNVYGDRPLVVGAATAARRGAATTPTPAVEGGSMTAVTFGGSATATIPAGTQLLSDPVELRVPDDSDLVVSLYLPGPTGPASFHIRGLAASFQAAGDAVGDSGGAYALMDSSRYFLSGVDVSTRSRGAVVMLGDSITDGVASAADVNRRYPDDLADRLLQRPYVREYGVLNAGMSGNRLLADAGAAGDSALRRFDRDVLAQSAVSTVVVLEGINDIGATLGAVDARDLIAGYRQIIARAHAAGLTAVGGTITPFEDAVYYTAAGEEDRQVVNEWIRTSGEFDAVADFDASLRDPEHPSRLLATYDSGDHLHPNEAGLAALADAVDLKDLGS
ncbi:lysophospholipase L1-like esterase [Marmoricola sp. URHA0025 HA25]